MENQKKCSTKKHKENNAVYYCMECHLYLCNKCLNHHSELFEEHHKYELDKEPKDIFTGICNEENHKNELKYFCKNHNKLCCVECLCKIKANGNGQHADCNVCIIEEIEEEKKSKLKENIKYLEEFSGKIQNSIKDLKEIYEKLNENKEKIKNKISKVFTDIRNALNEREDQLLLNIDNKFGELYYNEEFIKKTEKLQNEIIISLDKGKKMEDKLNKNSENLNLFINNCINVENNINTIKIMNKHINKFKSLDAKFNLMPKMDEKNKILEDIKNFGEIIEIDSLHILNLDNSLIIKNNEEYKKTLKNWINKDKMIKAELLYRLSRDGEQISKFHELCDDKGPTLTLFQVKEGYIGGIYTPLSWNTTSYTKKDNDTFMFNLNKNEKYTKKNNDISIYCEKDYGPWTNSFGFYNTDQMKKIQHGGNYINIGFDKGSNILPNDSLVTKYFEVKEAEVYKIIEI